MNLVEDEAVSLLDFDEASLDMDFLSNYTLIIPPDDINSTNNKTIENFSNNDKEEEETVPTTVINNMLPNNFLIKLLVISAQLNVPTNLVYCKKFCDNIHLTSLFNIKMNHLQIKFVYPITFTILLYPNGKFILTGTNNYTKIQGALFEVSCFINSFIKYIDKNFNKTIEESKREDESIEISNIQLVNSLGVLSLNKEIDLHAIVDDEKRIKKEIDENFSIIYEPELFPAAFIKFKKISIKVFNTGKVNFLGVKFLDNNFVLLLNNFISFICKYSKK